MFLWIAGGDCNKLLIKQKTRADAKAQVTIFQRAVVVHVYYDSHETQ